MSRIWDEPRDNIMSHCLAGRNQGGHFTRPHPSAQAKVSKWTVDETHNRICDLSCYELDDNRDVASVYLVVLLEDVPLQLTGLLSQLLLLGMGRSFYIAVDEDKGQRRSQPV
jgi:hypothetical protein